MARIAKPKPLQVAFRCSPEMAARLLEISEKTGISTNALVNAAVAAAFDVDHHKCLPIHPMMEVFHKARSHG